MQFKFIIAVDLAAVAVATPNQRAECTTGPIQCCNSIQKAGDPSLATIFGLLGIVVQDVNIPIGVTCSPISVIGVPGNSCSSQPVCCENNSFTIGCTPIDVNA